MASYCSAWDRVSAAHVQNSNCRVAAKYNGNRTTCFPNMPCTRPKLKKNELRLTNLNERTV